MRLLHLVTDFFVNTFGITQPSPKARDQAAWFIATMTALVLLGVLVFGLVGLHLIAK